MGFLRSSKKKNSGSSSTLSSYVEPPTPASRPSLPLSQRSDVSSIPEEKEHNPHGSPYSSPPPERYTTRVRANGADSVTRSQPAQVNVYVNSSAPRSTFRPSDAGQQPVPRHCGLPCSRRITRTSNRNGHAGRPYYVCTDCDKFVSWDDDIGLHDENPKCDCGVPSRRQITNADKGRKFFYKCVEGNCKFFEWQLAKDGTQYSVSEDVVEALRMLKVV